MRVVVTIFLAILKIHKAILFPFFFLTYSTTGVVMMLSNIHTLARLRHLEAWRQAKRLAAHCLASIGGNEAMDGQ